MHVIGDAARLRQVLLNLAGNAIKFTSTGGVALIVEPGIWPNEISFLVRDTGIGIPPEARERIFREFEQADDKIARSYGGTGLGLSISDRIVKRMGGRITLESEPGAGSTFEVSIPLSATDGEQTSFAVPDLSGQSIMLVSPQSIEASLTARRLQRWGGQTCMVADADVAEALLPERPWHAVLIDHALGLSDIERLGEAARLYATQRIVMFTPATRQELQPSAASALTGYLVKPLRAASLAARLTTAPEVAAPSLEPAIDFNRDISRAVGQGPVDPGCRGQSDQCAADPLAARPARPSRRHHHQRRRGAESSWLSAKSAGTPYDLVLMDIQMPQLNGIETTKRIPHPRGRRAGRPDADPRAHRQHAGRRPLRLLRSRHADGFLIKPLDREKLAEALAGLIATRHIAA